MRMTATAGMTTRRTTDEEAIPYDASAVVEECVSLQPQMADDTSAFPKPASVPSGPDWRRVRVTALKLGKVLTAKLQARGIYFMGELADRANEERLVETCGMTDVQANRFAEATEKFYEAHKVGESVNVVP